MKHLLDQLKKSFSVRISKGVKLKLTIDLPHSEEVLGDSHQLTQCINNFLSNAAKFTHHGIIHLICHEDKITKDKVYLSFVVHDTGIGMSKDILQNLFKPFRQGNTSTTRLYGGTGLGLYITKRLINHMEGDVRVESKPNKGTSFYWNVVMKRAPSESKSDIGTVVRTKRPAPAKVKVLLVEDNPFNQKLLAYMLNQLKCEYDTAENGLEAVKLAQGYHYSLILMDQHMPVMNGKDAARKIKNDERGLSRSTPIVALSANASVEASREATEAGMVDFLAKPLTLRGLEDMIQRHV